MLGQHNIHILLGDFPCQVSSWKFIYELASIRFLSDRLFSGTFAIQKVWQPNHHDNGLHNFDRLSYSYVLRRRILGTMEWLVTRRIGLFNSIFPFQMRSLHGLYFSLCDSSRFIPHKNIGNIIRNMQHNEQSCNTRRSYHSRIKKQGCSCRIDARS